MRDKSGSSLWINNRHYLHASHAFIHLYNDHSGSLRASIYCTRQKHKCCTPSNTALQQQIKPLISWDFFFLSHRPLSNWTTSPPVTTCCSINKNPNAFLNCDAIGFQHNKVVRTLFYRKERGREGERERGRGREGWNYGTHRTQNTTSNWTNKRGWWKAHGLCDFLRYLFEISRVWLSR